MSTRFLSFVGLLVVLLAAAPTAWAAGWATDDSGALYQVFPILKQVDRVGVIRVKVVENGRTRTETPSLTDIALHEKHGMYGITYTHLYRIDFVDPAKSVRVGPLRFGLGLCNALAFDEEGTLYALSGSAILVVDLETGRAKQVGSMGAGRTSDGDLAWIAGALYATVNDRLGCHLLRIDPKTWKVEDVGRIQTRTAVDKDAKEKRSSTHLETRYDDVWGLMWDGRVLWALTPSGEVLEIDPKTATARPHYRVRATFWGACPMLRV